MDGTQRRAGDEGLMFTVLDYIDVVDRCVERLRMLRKIIPDDDVEARMEVEYEINALAELLHKLKQLHPSLSVFTMH